MLPRSLVETLPEGARVVEIGVGGRWDTIAALTRARGDLSLAATDVHARALAGAPAGVEAEADDVFSPREQVYEGAQLLYAVRCPEELQAPIVRLGRRVGATVALSALKDEWAALDRLGRGELATGPEGTSWRIWRP